MNKDIMRQAGFGEQVNAVEAGKCPTYGRGLKMDVVEMAYQIIEMYEENRELKRKVKHLEQISKIQGKTITNSEKHGREMMGIMMNAVLDPDSTINQAARRGRERSLR